MTATQTKWCLSLGLVTFGAIAASPFYWYFSVRNPSPSNSTAIQETPKVQTQAVVPMPVPTTVIAEKSAPIQSPSPIRIIEPVAKPLVTHRPAPQIDQHVFPPSVLRDGERPYHYVFSGKISGAEKPTMIALSLENNRIGQQDSRILSQPDGSFRIEGQFKDQPRDEITWRLSAVGKEDTVLTETSGRFVLTYDTDLQMERTLVVSPS